MHNGATGSVGAITSGTLYQLCAIGYIERRFAKIATDIHVLKWVVGVTIALVFAVLIDVFGRWTGVGVSSTIDFIRLRLDA